MTPVARFEQAILLQHFAGIEFQNQREQDVFLSYLRGFSVLFFDPTVKHVVEVGAGQSTAILALLSERSSCSVTTIDMDPQALRNKIVSHEILRRIREHINFVNGPSVSRSDLHYWYERPFEAVGRIPAAQVLNGADTFIDTTMDNRKEAPVRRALNIPKLNVALVSAAILRSHNFPPALLEIYRNEHDELSNTSIQTDSGVLSSILEENEVNAVFLDSGEFSSLLEWEIVENHARAGSYVILHDIFFPKSFKNWLVCSSIALNPAWQVMYIDRSTPQGLMVARKN